MAVTLPSLTPAQESLFLTLGGRAMDSRLPRPFLGDPLADEILGKTGYDIARFPTLHTRFLDPKSKVFDITVRSKRMDEVVQRFVTRHPDAVVLELGAGLDTRMFRINPPPTVDWYDVDYPEVMTVRQQVVPERPNVHGIGANLTDPPHWLDDIPTGRPAVIVGDSLLGFLPQDDLVALLRRLTGRVPGGELTFNLYTTYAVWALKHLRSFARIAGGVVNPGSNDPREPERWVPGLKLVEEILLTRAPEVAELPLGSRLSSRLVAPSTILSRMGGTVVLRYRF